MLDLNPTDILIHILNIIVLYIVIRLLVYKPVRKFMRARADSLQPTPPRRRLPHRRLSR